jgi:phosphoribosylformylglycinamidine cyclo-ligase
MYNPEKPYADQVLSVIKRTWHTKYCEVTQQGQYAAVRKKVWYSPIADIDHTDGIGTKGYYLWKRKYWTGSAYDAFAMNINDLAMVRAIPYKTQAHLILPEELPVAIVSTMEQVANLAEEYDIAVTGGETSIQNTLNGIELALTMSGLIGEFARGSKYEYTFPPVNQCQDGDVLVGIASNGIHSNGWTKVREVFGDDLPDFCLKWTRLYYHEVKNICETVKVNAMMHITGGAFTKLRRILGKTDALIHNMHKLTPQRIFLDIYEKGKLTDLEMYKIFNCGIGFILSLPPQSAEAVLGKPDFDVIGRVVGGNGKVAIQSSFSNREIVL